MLTEDELGDLIDAHYHGPGDLLFHKEGLRWYDVPSQNATGRRGGPVGSTRPRSLRGPTGSPPTRLAGWCRSDCGSCRRLTDDELMSLHAALPIIARHEDVRVLHRGEHPVPDLVDHDYWIAPGLGRCGRRHRDALHRRWRVPRC